MRKSAYIKASSSSYSSYYGAKEKRSRKRIDILFAFIALIAIGFLIFMFLRFEKAEIRKKDAAEALAAAKNETTALEQERRKLESEEKSLETELDKLKLEYDSLNE